jgi:hypothetical protein
VAPAAAELITIAAVTPVRRKNTLRNCVIKYLQPSVMG